MELCSDNLMNIIKQKQIFFRRQETEAMNSIEYFISCEMFKEILECVQYLHESKPPIMHRDLNPKNILIKKIPENDIFLKLCDFDLLKEGDYKTHTRGQGTDKYMAPEVQLGTKYSLKCDIYSLGIVAVQLFQFNVLR